MSIQRGRLDAAYYGENVLAISNDKKAYKYEGDKRTDICEGFTILCVFPRMAHEKVNVRINDLNRAPLFPEGVEVPEDGVKVIFEGLELEAYRSRDSYGLAVSATAKDVRLASDSNATSKPTTPISSAASTTSAKDAK